MKMGTGTRALFTVFLVAVIALCVFVLGTLFGLVPVTYIDGIARTVSVGGFWYKFLYAAILIVVVVVGFMLMFFGVRKKAPKTAKIAVFESGSIVITVKAIEELVEKYVREVKSIKGLHSNVVSYNDYIDINVEIAVQPGSDIPELTKDLQFGLAEAIQKQTGITVKQTKISVMTIDDRTKAAVV